MQSKKNDYSQWTNNSLIERIIELEELVHTLHDENNHKELINSPWLGDLGHWQWIVPSDELVFNDKKATNLFYQKHEIPSNIGFEFFTGKLHPDDYEDVVNNMRNHLMNLTDSYEVEYRIINKKGDYAWYYDRGKVTKRNEEGKALIVSGVVFDISKSKALEKELKETNKALDKLVYKDVLTDAYNRRFLERQINKEIIENRKFKQTFSLIMLDIDNFKNINDDFGHNTGDQVLKTIAKKILSVVEKSHYLARWGGDEFILLLPNKDLNFTISLAKNIRKKVSESKLTKVGKVNISMGVSSYKNGDSTKTTIKKVDELLYVAKSKGNNYISYDLKKVI